MSSLNLIEFINSWLLATQVASSKIFDAIVYIDIETPESNEDIQWCDIYDFADIQMNFGISGKLQAIINNHAKVLIILSKHSIIYLLPFLQRNSENIVVVNTWAGISGAITKGQSELFDIDLVKTTQTKILEPSDGLQFFSLCKPLEDKNVYIRLAHLELAGSLEISWQEGYSNVLAPIDAEKTMLVSWALLGLFVSALDETQQGSVDLFTINQYYYPFSKELKESIEATKTLHIVLDASEQSSYIDFIKAQLYSIWLRWINLFIATPKRESTATILPEYFWEEVSFH
jgi:hypothetical protein